MSAGSLPSDLELDSVDRMASSSRGGTSDLASKYRRVRWLGSGGMGDVYEVEHVGLGARFAAKVLRPGRGGGDTSVRRFLREARLLARLKSDHIVRVVDVSSDEQENPFYVMELLDGQDLRGLLKNGARFSLSRAVKVVSDACVGLGVAHAAGLVHRDLKPENLFITHRDSGEEVCKLLDFGVSKSPGPATTEAGAVIGTVAYMAPEQLESAGTVTSAADVYALGAILYELLTGRAPHVADSVERLMFKVLTATPEPIGNLRSDVPVELERAVFRALARDPADRFGSAAEFAAALRPLGAPAGAPVTVRDGNAAGVPALLTRRRARLWFVGVGAALALLVALVTLRNRASMEVAPVPPENADLAQAVTVPNLTESAAPRLPPVNPGSPPASAEVSVAEDHSGPSTLGRSPAPMPKNTRSPKRPVEAGDATGAPATEPPSVATGLPKIQFELQNPYAKR